MLLVRVQGIFLNQGLSEALGVQIPASLFCWAESKRRSLKAVELIASLWVEALSLEVEAISMFLGAEGAHDPLTIQSSQPEIVMAIQPEEPSKKLHDFGQSL